MSNESDPTDVFLDMPPNSPTSHQFSRFFPLPYECERDPYDIEELPETLASGIQRFIRVGNLVESEEPRVAYLCRFYAFEQTFRIVKGVTGRDVRQFRLSLVERLEKDSDFTLERRKDKNDVQEVKRVYNAYKAYIITHGATFNLDNSEREKLMDAYRIASVLYEVLKAVNTSGESNQVEKTRELNDTISLKFLEDLILTPMSQEDASEHKDEFRPSSVVPSSFYEDKYLETQEKLNKVEKKIEEMNLKLKDVDFWTSLMQNMFPDQVPPSMKANQTENKNDD